MMTDERTPTPRPRGRPRVEKPMERISTRLPQEYYDRLTQLARKRDQSLNQLVRSLIITTLRKPQK